MASKKAKTPRVKSVRAKGEPQKAIQWFQDEAVKTQDLDNIRKAASKQGYAGGTISIQLGRLRAMGLLPKLESKAATEGSSEGSSKKKLKKSVKSQKSSSTRSRSFHPAPKPSQSMAAQAR